MTRTDVHSPSNLVTEDYEYLWAYDSHQPGVLVNVDMDWWHSISSPRANIHEQGQCDHCGARLRYIALLRHTPTGVVLEVGETCLENRFSQATARFHELRKAAELDRQAQRIKTAVLEFLEELREAPATTEDGHASAIETADFLEDKSGVSDPADTWEVLQDIRRKLWMYGSISDKQVALVAKSLYRSLHPAPVVEEVTIPVPEGRYVITGHVVSTKWQESDFGSVLKMLVKVTTQAGSYKVWGTVPRSLNVERGDAVSIKATVKRSDNDEAFGFFSRPTAA